MILDNVYYLAIPTTLKAHGGFVFIRHGNYCSYALKRYAGSDNYPVNKWASELWSECFFPTVLYTIIPVHRLALIKYKLLNAFA